MTRVESQRHKKIYILYLLTAIGLSPGGSTRLHTNNAQNNTNNNRTTQITTNVEDCRPCPAFASFTLAFALQLRKNYRKTSVRVRKTSVRLRKTSVIEKNLSQNSCLCGIGEHQPFLYLFTSNTVHKTQHTT